MQKKFKLTLLFSMIAIISAVTVYGSPSDPPLPTDPIMRGMLPFQPTNEESDTQYQLDATYPPVIPWGRVAYQSLRDNNWEIYISRDNGDNLLRLTNNPNPDIHPRLNRDSSKVIFTSRDENDYDIYMIDSDGTNLHPLTANNFDDVYPVWSPDNSKIAFQSYRDGQSEIYLMNADGSNVTRLTTNNAYDGYPTWSPDGNQIAFTSNRTGTYQIYTLKLDGSAPIHLPTNGDSVYPAWSPDGKKIAYSGDPNKIGWLAVWFMNSDGSNSRRLYQPRRNRDVWVSGWSPDGQFITYTEVAFVFYQEQWYWTEAHAWAIKSNVYASPYTINPSDSTIWNAHWASADGLPPTASISPLNETSTAFIPLNWSGYDEGGANIQGYDVQVKDSDSNVWQNWLINTWKTSATYKGEGGKTYNFRVRARDIAYNLGAWSAEGQAVTIVEAIPPQSMIHPIPNLVTNDHSLKIKWSGHDLGKSGIDTYDLQYKIGNAEWTDWIIETTDTEDHFYMSANQVALGEMIYFRVRAIDHAKNQEAWSEDNVVSTTFYAWKIAGTAFDNAGASISGVEGSIDPSTLASESDPNGNYAAYSASSNGIYNVEWTREGFGDLPATTFESAQDVIHNIYFPPSDNQWMNGNFENPTPITDISHIEITSEAFTGQFALQIGNTTRSFFSTPEAIPMSSTYTTNTYNHEPKIGFDSADNLHVIWSDAYYVDQLKYSYRNTSGEWSTPQVISNDINGVNRPQQIITKDDIVHVMFRADGYYYTRRNLDGTWSKPQQLYKKPADAGYQIGEYEFTVDTAQNIHLLWEQEERIGNPEIYYLKRTPDGTVEPASRMHEIVTAYQSGNTKPHLLTDSKDNVYMLWHSHNFTEGSHINFVSRTASGEFTYHEPLKANDYQREHSFRLEVTIDSSDKIHLIWQDGRNREVYYTSYNGVQWTNMIQLTSASPQYVSAFAADDIGGIHLVLLDNDIQSLFYLYQSSDDTWEKPVTIIHTNGNTPRHYLATGHNGQVFVIWGDSFVFKRPNGYWSIPVKTFYPHSSITVNSDNLAHIVWREGQINHITQINNGITADTIFSQSLTIPSTITEPTLSYLYQLTNASAVDSAGLFVEVIDQNGTTILAQHIEDTANWTHHSINVSAWAGEQVTITFRVHEDAEIAPPLVLLDDVSLGSAYPNVIVNTEDRTAINGEVIQLEINYANHGGAPAAGTQLALTLPPEMSYIKSSIPPLSTNPLVWDLGTLPPKSTVETFTVDVEIAETAEFNTILTPTAVITTTNEIDILNNTAYANIYIGRIIYLPTVFNR